MKVHTREEAVVPVLRVTDVKFLQFKRGKHHFAQRRPVIINCASGTRAHLETRVENRAVTLRLLHEERRGTGPRSEPSLQRKVVDTEIIERLALVADRNDGRVWGEAVTRGESIG